MQLPERGIPLEEIIAEMKEMKSEDADWRGSRTWSLIYPAGEEIDEVIRQAANLYLFENALNPFRFPSLRKMESDVVAMTANLLQAPEGSGGSMTSGGTESILMAVKTARDRARKVKGIHDPHMLVPYSAHPAFAKAAHYLDIEFEQIPLRDDYRADVEAARRLTNDRTVLIVGSAPNYPHGVIDPIPELAVIATERDISFHTDACVGGFLLPFIEMSGEEVPPFDFRVDGVTTMSADVHKYGYASKGASVVLHRSGSDLEYQAFLYDRWPGGIYGTFALAGARPAHPIAVSWAVMNYLGREGYMRLTQRALNSARRIRDGIRGIGGLEIVGEPCATLTAFTSKEFDIMAVGDVMDEKGWHLDRQMDPPALHMMVSPEHDRIVDEFLADLKFSVEHRGVTQGKEARYS